MTSDGERMYGNIHVLVRDVFQRIWQLTVRSAWPLKARMTRTTKAQSPAQGTCNVGSRKGLAAVLVTPRKINMYNIYRVYP